MSVAEIATPTESAEMPEGLPANDQKERLLKELKFAVEAVNDAEQSVTFGGKINHALMLAGEEGIGKDIIFEALRHILGGSNVTGVGPDVILDAQFDPYKKTLVLVIEEARDLGNRRYKLNNKLKPIIATTSTGLYVNENGIPQYSIPNHMFVCITTNHPDNGLYVNEGSRRYFVATSKVPPKDQSIPQDYFKSLHAWLSADGFRHVAEFLRARDLSGFELVCVTADERRQAADDSRRPSPGRPKDGGLAGCDGDEDGWQRCQAQGHNP